MEEAGENGAGESGGTVVSTDSGTCLRYLKAAALKVKGAV